MTLPAGKAIGKYRIVELVGRGGSADIYKAVQPGLRRFVAIKILHSFLHVDPNFVNRFRREALAVAALRHSNIIQVFDFDIEEGMPYMVLEYVEGISLINFLEQRYAEHRLLDVSELLFVMHALCSAVGYAHREGIVHRDIKPENVMLTSDKRIILADFGIARILGGQRISKAGQLAGTPEYMSPEQGRGNPGDARMDIYSLGIMLYELVMGDVPFQGSNPLEIMEKHMSAPLPRMRSIKPSLSPALQLVITKVLAKSPDDRYQTAEEFWTAVHEAHGKVNVDPPFNFFPSMAESPDDVSQRAVTELNVGTKRLSLSKLFAAPPTLSWFSLIMLILNIICLTILAIHERSLRDEVFRPRREIYRVPQSGVRSPTKV